jgi:hypothetical protein
MKVSKFFADFLNLLKTIELYIMACFTLPLQPDFSMTTSALEKVG